MSINTTLMIPVTALLLSQATVFAASAEITADDFVPNSTLNLTLPPSETRVKISMGNGATHNSQFLGTQYSTQFLLRTGITQRTELALNIDHSRPKLVDTRGFKSNSTLTSAGIGLRYQLHEEAQSSALIAGVNTGFARLNSARNTRNDYSLSAHLQWVRSSDPVTIHTSAGFAKPFFQNNWLDTTRIGIQMEVNHEFTITTDWGCQGCILANAFTAQRFTEFGMRYRLSLSTYLLISQIKTQQGGVSSQGINASYEMKW